MNADSRAHSDPRLESRSDSQPDSDGERLRLDVWLWAARFFRTRTLAKEAIEGGKVQVEGQRAKVSKAVRTGMKLLIRQGYEEREVEILALSDTRGPAPVAQQLYAETPESLERREQARLQRQLAADSSPADRPSKKGRRMIHRFKRDLGWS